MSERDSKRVVRRLGRTGFEVNVLGLGGHTYPVGDEPGCYLSPEARAHLIRYLVSAGVNYFDTTYVEEVELLADSLRRADIKKDMLISLYGGSLIDQQWREKLRHEIESRLDILGYASAPLFIISVGNGEASYSDIVAACEAMARLKEEKLAHNIGISCHAINLFPLIGRVIRETDAIDYIMIRFNWKFQQANEGLFPIAEEHDVGIVGMKLFCWDCGPGSWDKRISVFEPVDRVENDQSLTPAQRHLLWCIRNSPCDVFVPAMNSMREAEQNIQALKSMDAEVGTDDFEKYGVRLWDREEIKKLALHAESETIRVRAAVLWKSGNAVWRSWHLLIRTIRAHYGVLRSEGIKGYLLRSYNYRKGRLFRLIDKTRA